MNEQMKKIPNWQEFQAALATKAINDINFRKELLTDPRGVIEQELATIGVNTKLPATLNIQVIEQPVDTLCIVLPPADALDDETLDKVVGGSSCDTLWGCDHNGSCKHGLLCF